MHLEPLEGRRLLAATLADGVLTLTGDATNNYFVVRFRPGGSDDPSGGTIIVTERTLLTTEDATALPRRERLRRGGPFTGQPTRTSFSANDVTSIVADLGAGNDYINLQSNVTEPATVNGGEGGDTLLGGGGTTTLNGGPGDDFLTCGRGAATLNGNEGDDTLRATGASATLNGGDGADRLSGGPSPDTLSGGAGNDTIRSSGGGKDTVDGGTDALLNGEAGDIAHVDAATETDENTGRVREPDVVTNVEAVRSGRRRGGWGWWEDTFTVVVNKPLPTIFASPDR